MLRLPGPHQVLIRPEGGSLPARRAWPGRPAATRVGLGAPPPESAHRGVGGPHPDAVRLGSTDLMAANLPLQDLNIWKGRLRGAGRERRWP